jgi:hypothetical protein
LRRYGKDLDKEMADNVSRDREQRAALGGVEARVVGTDGLCWPRHHTHFEPSFLDLNDIL